ncbi:MAG TPA: hypothetical protein VNV66_12720 [Pilimelia sp.]|nr:hypothetical protein [Pilimelia sp.]
MADRLADVARLLYGSGARARPGAPEPTLLGWLAGHLDHTGLPAVRRAAARAGRAAPPAGWPVIAEAVEEVLGARGAGSAAERAYRVPAGFDPADAPAAGRLTPVEAAYLLPTLTGAAARAAADAALVAVRDAARCGDGWYVAALCARVAPYLRADRLLADLAPHRLAPPWQAHVHHLVARAARWPSVAAEVAAAHPAVPRLRRAAAGLPADALAALCARAVEDILSRYPDAAGPAGEHPPRVDGHAPPRVDSHAPPPGGRPGRRSGAPVPQPPDGGAPGQAAPPPPGGGPPGAWPRGVPAARPGNRSGPATPGRRAARPGAEERQPRAEPPARVAARPAVRRQPPRWVSTGVADPAAPTRPLPPDRRLAPDTPYLFWFQVGRPVPGSLEAAPGRLRLPADAAPGTRLTVALFGYPDEILPAAGADRGELVLGGDGVVVVHRQPDGRPAGGQRLYFPIRTPHRAGRHRLRCSLYGNGTLLQSRLVELDVGPPGPGACVSTLDYAADVRLDQQAELAAIPPVTLSVFVNDNGGGTHGFRFLAGGGGPAAELKGEAVLGEGELQDLVTRARDALRQASWGEPGEHRPGTPFRYDRAVPVDWARDLVRLAVTGYVLWTTIGGELAEAAQQAPAAQAPIRRLAEHLRCPGVVEVAGKASSRLVVPAALFYDYPLDQGLDLRLCPTAAEALRHGGDLAEQPCFRGACPAYDDRAVVCPGGFWGYRHELGLPQSALPVTRGEVGPGQLTGGGHEIRCGDRPHCVVGISREFDGPHPEWVRRLGDRESRLFADREALLDALGADTPPAHLVYFFCHGAVVDGEPALLVGPPDARGISFVQLADGRLYWPQGRPLVLLNGCRTAAVEPRYAMSFVDAFVRRARASGVIGTEIVTYEALAEDFGRAVLDRFVNRRQTLAAAVRGARLELLAAGNPLGLIYVVYASPHLRLAGAARPA